MEGTQTGPDRLEVDLKTASLLENSKSSNRNDHNNIDPQCNFLDYIKNESKYYNEELLCKTLSNKKGLSVIHFNIRSLNTNFQALDLYLSQLEVKFDIIAITETWFSQSTAANVFNIKGYELKYVSRNVGRGGGVALYVNSSLKCKTIENKCICVDGNFECITVELSVNGSKNIILACVYRKPGGNINEFSDKLEEMFSNLKNKVLYICGDFNIDLLKEQNHSQTKYFIDTMFSMGLYPLITKPSRIAGQSTTLIDNIFTNELQHKSTSGILLNDITDHFPVFMLYEYRVKREQDCLVSYRRLMDGDSVRLLNDVLQAETWDKVYSQNDVDSSYEYFLQTLESHLEKCCPMSTKYVNNNKKNKPWITKGLVNACKKKNRMYVTALKSKLKEDDEKYKVYKNKLTKILRAAEKSYYNKQLEEQKFNIKGTWKILNEVLRGSSSTSKIPDVFLEDSNEIKDKKDIADGFNNFFVNVGPNLAKTIQAPANMSVNDYLPDPNVNTMFLDPVTEQEVVELVKKFSNKTSLDCHGISMLLIKQILTHIVKPFTHICNLSFEIGIFPDLMKMAKVLPIFKSGKNNIYTNYRPVSLLPQFSKILEKLFNNRMDKFLNKYNIISENQYGFRENRSTNLALMELIEDLTQSLDNQEHTIGVFIDLKKAFDTIDHKILLQKLYNYGLRGKSNDWIRSYLKNRKQYVKIEECKSELMDVVCGVPQGSILGPKLFIIYINDMIKTSKLLKFILFADDTNIFCSGKDVNELSKLVTRELDKLKNWFATNKLSLNVTKTNFMLFSRNADAVDIEVKIDDVIVNRVDATKFLGVVIDDKLTWKKHIETVKSKVSKSIFLLNRAKYVLSYDAMLILYNSIVLPHLTYCCEIWGNTYETRWKGLFILQKRAMRIIHGVGFRDHTNLLFHRSRALKLNDLVKLNVAMIMYKAFNSSLPQNLQKLFIRKTYNDNVITTRQIEKFKQPAFRTTMKGMCISVCGVTLWNSLSKEITMESRSQKAFKASLKKMLLKRYLEN